MYVCYVDDPHYCEDQCHLGECAVCDKQSNVTCKCGKSTEVHTMIDLYIVQGSK